MSIISNTKNTRIGLLAWLLVALHGALPAIAQVSDDFNGASFNSGLWTAVDPMGDSGLMQSNGRLIISVPGGASHDLWGGGNNAARAIQAVADVDFEVEAKFESTPSLSYQIQGVLVQQDIHNYLRLDYYYTGSSLALYAAGFVNDAPVSFGSTNIPAGNFLYLRLKRTGNQWEARYSYDGVSWVLAFSFSHAMSVSGSGVYAGNVGAPAPAFDAIVDYYFNTASPIVPEDGGVVDVTAPVMASAVVYPSTNAARAVFTTDEPAVGRVSYGLTPALELGTVAGVGYMIYHSLDLTGLSSGTPYYVRFEAEDTSANVTQDTIRQFTTWTPPNYPPIVTVATPAAGTTYVVGDSVSIGVTAFDSDGTVTMVEFMADSAVIGTVLSAPWEFVWQSVSLGHHDLTARATDDGGATGVSVLVPITVNPAPGLPTAVSDDFSAMALDDTLWTFLDPVGGSNASQANGVMTISVAAGMSHNLWNNGNNSARLMQSVADVDQHVEAKFESLPTAAYQIEGLVAAQDSLNFVRFDIFHDGANLRIFAAQIVNNVPTVRANLPIIPSSGLAWLRMTRTGDQWVGEYSLDGTAWVPVFSFVQALSVNSTGVFAGNVGAPAPAFDAVVDYFFDTNDPIVPEDGGLVDVWPPVITNVLVTSGVTDATITFTTNELTTGRVRYGLTPVLELGVVSSATPAMAHGLMLTGLTPVTTYYYQIEAEDGSLNLSQNPPAQLMTLPVANLLPVVILDVPLAGTRFAVGDTIVLSATATDGDGFVTRVDFLADGAVVDSLFAAPWQTIWTNASVGNHTLIARAVDDAGDMTLSAGVTVTVTPAPGDPVAISDDFSGLAFNDTVWTFVNPVGDGAVSQTNGLLTLSAPSGASHDLWMTGNQSVRVVQPVADVDLDLQVKFESMPVARYQMQGVVLENSPGNYVRIDYYHDGSDLHLFGASFVGNNPTVRGDVAIPVGGPLWIGVNRTGNAFDVAWSNDGLAWHPAFNFVHTTVLNRVGVYAGNSGSPAPAFDAVVDYFFDTAAPVVPEDGGGTDVWPPQVGNVVVVPDPATGSALVICTTDESATTLINYGPTTAYGAVAVGVDSSGVNHQFTMSGLLAGATIHFSIEATDTLGNVGTTSDAQFVNVDLKPAITVWGGLNQRVGHLGDAQADVNVVGNIARWSDLASLTYRLNGGPEIALNWGNRPDGFGDGRRLAHNGDFNADIPVVQLQAGLNTVLLHAVDVYGREDLVAVSVDRQTGHSSFPYNVQWAAVANPQDVGQTVDGRWNLGAQGLRTVSTGYDRIFLMGDSSWQDYEIVCPITIHEIQTPGPFSDKAGMGFLTRFTGHIVGGHRNWPDVNPKWGYQPFGGLCWLRWLSGASAAPTVQYYYGDYDVQDNFGGAKAAGARLGPPADPAVIPFGAASMTTDFGVADKIVVGQTFFMKMRVETLPDAANGDGMSMYSLKVWLNTEIEPVSWNYQVVQQSQYALRQGGVGLLAHHLDVTFGDVTVVNLSAVAGSGDELPTRFALADNYPNPFNPMTKIAFEVPRAGQVRLSVFDIRGQLVANLVDEHREAGQQSVIWRGMDDTGRAVSSGQYFYRLDASGLTSVKKMMLLK